LAAIRGGDPDLIKPSLQALASVSPLLEDERKTLSRFAAMTVEEVAKPSKKPKVRHQRRS
jgi:hypothetical protein